MNFRIRIILAQLSLFASLSPILNNPVVDARKNDSAILITANALLKNGVFCVMLQEGSSQNCIKGNMQNENGDAGIRLDRSNSNQISENVAHDNGNDGIELEVSQSNTITGNTAMKPRLKRDGA